MIERLRFVQYRGEQVTVGDIRRDISRKDDHGKDKLIVGIKNFNGNIFVEYILVDEGSDSANCSEKIEGFMMSTEGNAMPKIHKAEEGFKGLKEDIQDLVDELEERGDHVHAMWIAGRITQIMRTYE